MTTLAAKRDILPLLFMYALVLTALMPSFEEAFRYDILCWQQWTHAIMERGIAHIYDTNCNYPPVYLYLLWAFGKLLGSPENIDLHIRYVRLIPLFFEFVLALSVWAFFPKAKAHAPFILLLNLALLYNSVIWAQLDGIYTCGVIWAIYFAWQQKWEVAALLFMLALNTKLQALVFAPVIALLFLPMLRENWRRIFPVGGTLLAVQLLLLLPFLLAGTTKDWWETITGLVGYYPKVSMAAMNVWYLLMPGLTPQSTNDTELFGLLTYKAWGLISMLLVLIPIWGGLAWQLWRRPLKALYTPQMLRLVLLSATWTQLGVFFFATQMHERYAYPVLALLCLYLVLTKRWWPYLLVSVAYFLNLEEVMRRWPTILSQESLWFDNRFIACVWLMALLVVGYEWVRTWRTLWPITNGQNIKKEHA